MKYKATVNAPGITGYQTPYRQTPHSAVNAAFRSVVDDTWGVIGHKKPFDIALWKRVETGRVLRKTWKWELVCILSVSEFTHEGVTRYPFMGTDPKGREFHNTLPLPKWTNPGSNIIQG